RCTRCSRPICGSVRRPATGRACSTWSPPGSDGVPAEDPPTSPQQVASMSLSLSLFVLSLGEGSSGSGSLELELEELGSGRSLGSGGLTALSTIAWIFA